MITALRRILGLPQESGQRTESLYGYEREGGKISMMFRRLDHVGVVVKDLAEARRWLGEVFGLPHRRSIAAPERQVRAEFYGCGAVDVEVIELGDPEARRLRLGEGVQARIDHIAVEVEDLQATLSALAALGVRTTLPEPRRSSDGLSTWTVAETTGGISYQLIEKRPGRPPADA